MKAVKELREQRAKLVDEARAILDKAEAEKRDLSKEDEAKWDQCMADADKLKAEIDRLERQMAADSELQERIYQRAGREDTDKGEAERRTLLEKAAFRNWLKGGMSALTDEQRNYMISRMGEVPAEARALSVGTTTAGGYTVPQDFREELEKALLAFGGMRSVATILRTATGAALPMPTVNDTSNAGAILAENTQVSEQDVTFGQLTLDAYMYTSKLVRVSLQLLQDSAFSIESFLRDILAERIARITNTHFTTGTGSGQPNGIVTAATLGKTGTTGQTTSVIYNDLVDLEHSIDPSYRRRPGTRWMFADSTLKAIKKLVDGQSRPLWAPGITVGEPDTILGYRYEINQDVAAMAANAKSILFGDFSKYLIRDVLDVQLMRFNERYMDFLQIAFMSYSRHDGDLLDAGTHPVKYYANSAT